MFEQTAAPLTPAYRAPGPPTAPAPSPGDELSARMERLRDRAALLAEGLEAVETRLLGGREEKEAGQPAAGPPTSGRFGALWLTQDARAYSLDRIERSLGRLGRDA